MTEGRGHAAVVALLRRRSWEGCAELLERCGDPFLALDRELSGEADGDGHLTTRAVQGRLLVEDPAPLLAQAEAEITRWHSRGIRLLSVLDEEYPANLRAVHDRPPLLFLTGELSAGDRRSLAVIGTRRPSAAGVEAARAAAASLVAAGFVVISGLASGIDTAAHTAALAAGGRTLAVIGTGLGHSYPPQNAHLQARIASTGALVSRFWPECGPSRTTFPQRNAVMSGLSLGTLVVEASEHSGARVQTRMALAHGRPVFLLRPVLAQRWARELGRRPGVHVVDGGDEAIAIVKRLTADGPLVD